MAGLTPTQLNAAGGAANVIIAPSTAGRERLRPCLKRTRLRQTLFP